MEGLTRPAVTHLVATDNFAGVERQVCDTAAELASRGWPVTVIGGEPDQIRSVLPDGVRHLPAPTAARAILALARHRTDILHTHMTAAEAAAIPFKGHTFDHWVTTRHFGLPRGSSRLGRLARRRIEAGIDVQIAISDFVAGQIGESAVVVPNGVPPSSRMPGTRARTVVVMQRLEAEKDTALALEAFDRSGLQHDGWTLRICGRGSLERDLRARASDLGLNVDFAGFVPDARDVLRTAGIVLATATAEPFGLTVVEAMAEGAPVVASAGGAHPETLGADAQLFPVGDARAASVLLRALATDTQAADAYGARLQRRHAERFTISRHVDVLEGIYTRLISSARGDRGSAGRPI